MTAPSDSTAAAPTHTLASLRAALGLASLDEALALVEGHDKPSLVVEGARVATPRISTDAARIYGQAYDFVSRATDDQLDQLPGLTKQLLRIAVWTAGEGDNRYQALNRQSQGDAVKQSSAGAGADALRPGAEAKRDQLHTALVLLSGGSPSLLAQATVAYGSAADLAGAITAQVALAQSWLAAPVGNMAARIQTTRLSADWLSKAAAIGTAFGQASGQAGVSRSQAAMGSADVDLVDGINLLLLRNVAAQFEAAHAADPTIPRLTFNALRSHVHRSHHTAPVTTPAKPATTPATSPAKPV